ncbi:hypothetical protein Pan161_19070 [Gimesia algae]|uniref:Uncharacterized protein n=2 Tax=Gimesia algae TaxID=2527971 RepID=A0A517VB79_9PLAN|nr:hypothetical protein Pan161_19070 [Gimesia algae]
MPGSECIGSLFNNAFVWMVGAFGVSHMAGFCFVLNRLLDILFEDKSYARARGHQVEMGNEVAIWVDTGTIYCDVEVVPG